jgi:hypothetical protein
MSFPAKSLQATIIDLEAIYIDDGISLSKKVLGPQHFFREVLRYLIDVKTYHNIQLVRQLNDHFNQLRYRLRIFLQDFHLQAKTLGIQVLNGFFN